MTCGKEDEKLLRRIREYRGVMESATWFAKLATIVFFLLLLMWYLEVWEDSD